MRCRSIITHVAIAALLAAGGCRAEKSPERSPPAEAESATGPRTAPTAPAMTQTVPGTDLSFEMVLIPAGRFVMGSPGDEKKRGADEGPPTAVAVDAFYMGKYEVTWDLYNEFMNQYMLVGQQPRQQPPFEMLADAVSYPTPIYDIEAGPELQRMGGRNAGYPAMYMSHFAAKQFTKWLSAKTGRFYRLPTEAEWEYAARGGTTTAYFFGDDADMLDDYGWYYDNSELADGDVGYHKVGGKRPNPFGLYDMYGNVAEMVLDQYEPAYQRRGTALHQWREVIRWPDEMYPRIARGGSYDSDPEDCRSAARSKVTVQVNYKDMELPKSVWWWMGHDAIGFRLVSPVEPPAPAEQHRFWDADSEKLLETLKLKEHRLILQLLNEVRPVEE